MSYILDALKKAEREHELAEIPTIETVHDRQAKKKTGVWIVAGCGALCLIAAVWLFISTPTERVESVESVESKDPASAVLYPDSGIKGSGASPENRELAYRSSKTSVSDGIVVNLPVTKTTDVSIDSVSEANRQSAVAAPENSGKAAMMDEITPKSPPVRDYLESAASGTAKPAGARLESRQRSRDMPSLREIATSMKMNIHFYSETPEKRMVFIIGVKYVEGASLEYGCVLESITPEGAIMKRGNEMIFIHTGDL